MAAVTNRQLVALPVRRHFRDLATQTSVLRLIAGMWEDQGFVPSGDPNDEASDRRTLWHEYEDNADWTDLAHVARVLRVYESLLGGLTDGMIDSTRKFLDRQGFDLDADGRIKLKADSIVAAAARVPRSLGALRDPTMILDGCVAFADKGSTG